MIGPSDLGLPAIGAGTSAPLDLVGKRAYLAQALAAASPTGMIRVSLGGCPAIRLTAPEPTGTTIVHFHGGGYRQGQPEMVAAYAATLARTTGADVICPSYRLAPEHPFPAALVDGYNTVAAVSATSDRVILSGDSAGGGLAAALAQICAAQSLAVDGLILHSPWLDLTVTSETYAANRESDPLFSEALAREASGMYLQGHAAANPLASPVAAGAARYPPTLITVGSGEVLLGDSDTFARRVAKRGGQVRLIVIDGMEHVAVTRDFSLPGAMKAFDEAVDFIRALG